MFYFPKLNKGILLGLFAGLMLNQPGYCETTSFAKDQIAAHFSQVFGEPGKDGSAPASPLIPDSGIGDSIWDVQSVLSLSGTWIAPTEVKYHPESDIQTSFGHLTYGLSIPLSPGKTLGIVTTASQFHISESGPVEGHVFPFSDIWQWDAGIVYTHNINPRLDIFGGISGIMSGGNSHTIKDGINGLGYIGGVFRITPNLSAAAGIAMAPDHTAGQRSVPLVMLDWRINDSCRLSVRNGVYFEYAHNGDWKNVIGAGVDAYAWLVDLKGDSFPQNGNNEYALEVVNASGGVFYRHTFDSKLEATAKVILSNWNQIGIYRDDDEIRIDEFKTSVGFSLSLGYSF
ncbi:MAG TPA: hypothetical protein PKX94_01270 [Opitutales bacterium]|nr:hypothetical protein [Opitutales bacterium]